jgi:hypothetical protein
MHVILDNYATQQHPMLLAQCESRLAALTRRRLRRGGSAPLWISRRRPQLTLPNTTELKPFVWTADPDRVLAAIRRGKQAQP